MTKKLIETVKTLITNGPPHQDTLDAIEEEGFMILKSVKLHELRPDYGMDTDFITFYAKIHVVEMIEGSFMPPDSYTLTVSNDDVILDGFTGKIVSNPTEFTLTPHDPNIDPIPISPNSYPDTFKELRDNIYSGLGLPSNLFEGKYLKPSNTHEAQASAELFIDKSLPSYIIKGLKEKGFTDQ